MKMSCGSKDLYRGTHYHCVKNDLLKPETVRLKFHDTNKYTIQVGSQIRTFREDEFCFFEFDEMEYITKEVKTKNRFMSMRKKKPDEENKNFICLTIVFFKVNDDNECCMHLGSNRVKLFDKVVPGSVPELRKLKETLLTVFGRFMKQWFMYHVEDNNNEHPVRVILRKTNFSVLDERLHVLYFHRLKELELEECFVNPLQRLFIMTIIETNTCLRRRPVYNIKLRSSLNGEDKGYSFRTELSNQLHKIRCNSRDDENCDESYIHNSVPLSDSCSSIEYDDPPSPCHSYNLGRSFSSDQIDDTLPETCHHKPPVGHMLRAESVNDLYFDCCSDSNDDDVTQCKRTSATSSDDNEYQRIYYKNVGWTKCYRKTLDMLQRIQRQIHINRNIHDVNFETVDKHEKWWDNEYQTRQNDELYTRCNRNVLISNNNIQSSEAEDMYWNGDLCVTIQLMMERKYPKISGDLDLSWSQMIAVIIHLSVDQNPACFRKDWRDLAEVLGLRTRDMEIIQYFCYSQREWTGRVVLCHWKLLTNKGRNVPNFNFYNLRRILLDIGRMDILKIIDYSETNCVEDVDNECSPL